MYVSGCLCIIVCVCEHMSDYLRVYVCHCLHALGSVLGGVGVQSVCFYVFL